MKLPLERQMQLAGLPAPESEYRFHPSRRWRFDYAVPDKSVAIEVEGGAWISGRHTRGAGYVADLEKYNTATVMGWRVLRFTPQQISDGTALNLIEQLLKW
jgi:very-short-patch-repair endonuclease